MDLGQAGKRGRFGKWRWSRGKHDKRGGRNTGGAGLGQAATERGAKTFSNKVVLNIVSF